MLLFQWTLNSGVGTSTVCVANHGLVNNILLNMLANGDDVPSPTNLTILAAIAEMCPIEGGDAVYEARAIVERLTGETYDDAILCASEERPSNEREDDQTGATDIRVFPNPTTGHIYWTGLEGQIVTARVFNMLGQQVAERSRTAGNFDLSALPAGIYQLFLSTPDNAVFTSKRIVIEGR